MSALLFMFICRLCNSYKLLFPDRLLHLIFRLLNSSSSFIFFFDSITMLYLDASISVPHRAFLCSGVVCVCVFGVMVCFVFLFCVCLVRFFCGQRYATQGRTVLLNEIPLKYCFRVN